MIIENSISPQRFKMAIEARHHFFERFFDVGASENDRNANLEILSRIESGTASKDDIKKANSIIVNPYN